MIRRLSATLAALAVALAACSGEEPLASTTVPSTSTTTTSTIPSTTTTLAPVSVEGAPPALAGLIDDFYSFASGAISTSPPAPPDVLAVIEPGEIEVPREGEASVAAFAEEQVAVVVVGPDTFLAVEDATGWRIVGGEWPSLDIDQHFGEGPRHVAVVGSDARPGQDVASSRADSIHFVALDGEGAGAIVGLPRDSFLPLPGRGRTKITNSLSIGGPDLLMGALQDLTALPLEGYVMTGFAGFETMLGEVLGGVTVEVPFAINDRWAHVNLSSGLQMLDGAQALGFARARKTVSGGDFARSEHQGMLLIAAAGVVQSAGLLAIPELMELSAPHLVTDLTPEQLLTFSAMAVSADLEEIDNLVAPGSPGSAGGASVVFLHDSASELWADLADGALEE
ncbi:MAG TPA: LCP family protein [Acidimicrobiia bacterium]|nr:LCP family protein [Acidimicrobiia bacterium]